MPTKITASIGGLGTTRGDLSHDAPCELRQSGGTRAMAHCSSHRNVRELHPFARASQQQTASAHISAADKLRGKHQPLSKNSEQMLNVFRCRDTTQHNDCAIAHVIAKQSR